MSYYHVGGLLIVRDDNYFILTRRSILYKVCSCKWRETWRTETSSIWIKFRNETNLAILIYGTNSEPALVVRVSKGEQILSRASTKGDSYHVSGVRGGKLYVCPC